MLNERNFEGDVWLLNNKQLVNLLMDECLILKEYACTKCNQMCSINRYKKIKVQYAWRCTNRQYDLFKFYVSVLKGLFFEQFNIPLRATLGIIAKYANRVPRKAIAKSLNVSDSSILKVINKLVEILPVVDFSNNKLGGGRKKVQIDETMLNYKCKSHRGRSPTNRTDCLCLVEVGVKIERVYAVCIPNKKAETILPIICEQVVLGATVQTDEAACYKNLTKKGYIHGSACHKYNFVNKKTGDHTQNVESFNNCIKLAIKMKKSVLTTKRPMFVNEFCFFWNNKSDVLKAI